MEKPFDYEIKAVQPAPYYKPPRRPMPQSAKQHRYHEVDICSELALPVAAEGDVEEIPQPGRKGDMPSPPEIGETYRAVWEPEIVGQDESHAQCNAYRTQGIATEIEIYLRRES